MKKKIYRLFLFLLMLPITFSFTACDFLKPEGEENQVTQTFTVQFNSNGGSHVSILTDVPAGSKINEPEVLIVVTLDGIYMLVKPE